MSNENLKKCIEEIHETIKVQGNNYVKVHTRIKSFRIHTIDDYSITTTHHIDDKNVFARTEIKNKEGRIIATGASSKKGLHAVEKSETASIGRALACLGIGIDEGYASADEMQDANINNRNNHQNNTPPPISKSDISQNNQLLKQIEKLLPEVYNTILPIVDKRSYTEFLVGISGQVKNWIKDNTKDIGNYLSVVNVNSLQECKYLDLIRIVELIQQDIILESDGK